MFRIWTEERKPVVFFKELFFLLETKLFDHIWKIELMIIIVSEIFWEILYSLSHWISGTKDRRKKIKTYDSLARILSIYHSWFVFLSSIVTSFISRIGFVYCTHIFGEENKEKKNDNKARYITLFLVSLSSFSISISISWILEYNLNR
jgi:hypothetical protein